jgi:serine/threonine protein phosphatase PrpC
MKNEEAVSIVAGCETPEQACDRLVQESKRRWLQEEEGVVDDITIIVVFYS